MMTLFASLNIYLPSRTSKNLRYLLKSKLAMISSLSLSVKYLMSIFSIFSTVFLVSSVYFSLIDYFLYFTIFFLYFFSEHVGKSIPASHERLFAAKWESSSACISQSESTAGALFKNFEFLFIIGSSDSSSSSMRSEAE